MIKSFFPLALAAIAIPGGALAQTPTAEPAMAESAAKPGAETLPVITDNTKLYEKFGGREGLVAIMDDAMNRWMSNSRTRPFFENADRETIKMHLVEQFCVIMDGPCTYTGRTMAESHRGQNIPEGAFYALAEELQKALNAKHVPFAAQNRLIAALAPMHRDIVNK
ncbi:MAG: group I truncated hemoglobin [Novosphingobium sp.]